MPSYSYYYNSIYNANSWLGIGTTAPASNATTTTGWTVARLAATRYSAMNASVERNSSTFNTTSSLNSSSGPNNTLKDCFRTQAFDTQTAFDAGTWTFNFPCRASSAGGSQDGNIRVRLWKSSNVTDGSSPTQITSSVQSGSTVTNLATGTTQTSTGTMSLDAFTVDVGEALFLQVEWCITGASSSNNSDVLFYQTTNTPILISTNYTEILPFSYNYGMII
jgi:hypothetical protein